MITMRCSFCGCGCLLWRAGWVEGLSCVCVCEGGTNADANMDWTCSQGQAVQPLIMQHGGAQAWEQRSSLRA